MGWVLSGDASERISLHHRVAISAFSWVTAAFQVFFAFWIFESIGRSHFAWLTFCFAAICFIAALVDVRAAMVAAIAVFFMSCYVIWNQQGDTLVHVEGAMSKAPSLQVIFLAPVMLFGFLLCPYLDATFHTVRQRSSDQSCRFAFAGGFGAFFLLMLLFALSYATLIAEKLGVRSKFTGLIGFFWCIQLALTIAFHWWFGTSMNRLHWDAPWVRIVATLAVGYSAWLVARLLHEPLTHGGETVYRVFMAFYGLVFPAYVWLCMIPGRGRVTPNRRQLLVWAGAVIVAAPMFWMGFIEGKMIWLLPGLGVVLLARVLVPSSRPGQRGPLASAATDLS
jgi:hypothetical protein